MCILLNLPSDISYMKYVYSNILGNWVVLVYFFQCVVQVDDVIKCPVYTTKEVTQGEPGFNLGRVN